ncbi:acyl carrier protein [Vibrio parahaemolyticus]|jgi:acyl carrier protein|uniref:Acyl carrier protein n=4 Tax=Vibrio parahaemolyticus TaxID=670 RepID=A0A072FTE0_VIBPH|nr:MULTISPECIES: acyl carrier protein [Vibrio]EFO36483.1 acyl carrier protein [Vibrio parahaemolyticus Peru-466]EFO46182.1 acyl carrier protein [Vibrio parahaemolyticus AQ4037]EFO52912.1 acyl carrier protein [Vibrio parahaemolyticus K5030]EJG0766473.1 acyl carrier protein [Vibrio parahaemolyticus O5:K30]EJG0874623.1 acyl carrier protein [Vibrio parahaemolyticus O3]EJG0903243.1 acyl carrier protein [Vibrio parahaemolyticus O3:K56]EJG0921233.1 acyl carrier protein [Vibrio parahaemolyticus O1:K
MTDVNKDQVFEQVKDALVELFEIDADDIQPDAHLYQDLDLDSIDAVDLVVHLQNVTGKKIKPAEFSTVRTVDDVVNAVTELLKES